MDFHADMRQSPQEVSMHVLLYICIITTLCLSGTASAQSSLHVRHDLNGDGRADILWRSQCTHPQGCGWTTFTLRWWWMDQTSVLRTASHTVDDQFYPGNTGDFDGDGRADILWYSREYPGIWSWRSRGDGTYDQKFIGAFDTTNWLSPQFVGDLDGDGKDDILWQDIASTRMAYWLMDGASVRASRVFEIAGDGGTSHIVGTGDFDGDGRVDILLSRTDNTLHLWRSQQDGGFSSAFIAAYDPSWHIVGVSDLDGDHRADISWTNTSIYKAEIAAYWLMNAARIVGSGVHDPKARGNDPNSRHFLVNSADYDGDGRSDWLWRREPENLNPPLLYLWRSLGGGHFQPMSIGPAEDLIFWPMQ